MSFDLHALREAVAAHGRVARVVVAETAGSAPREAGAAMLVWPDGDSFGQSGTIGGGTLEHEATLRARARLAGTNDMPELTRHPLGPALGQCCGGAVTLVCEVYEAAHLEALETSAACVARRVSGAATGAAPLVVQRHISAARGAGIAPTTELIAGWLIEPVAAPTRALWIWGAGHVGRALIRTLSPLPGLAITWVDTGAERFPAEIPANVTRLVGENPADLVSYAPVGAEHLIVTYSHALDFELCHRLLGHGFAAAGLIGSASKWTRFRKRLGELGHGDESIARITCPIGAPELGKHPQAIAIGVAGEILRAPASETKSTAREASQ